MSGMNPAANAAIAPPIALRAGRVPCLDALRGLFALTVMLVHCLVWSGLYGPPQAVNAAVDGFFLLSGYVLALSYDGRFLPFLARRFVRLWPVYAICLTAGYALHGMLPIWQELLWIPSPRLATLGLTDKPVWTLYIEAWAAPCLPVLVTIARRHRIAGMAVAGLIMLAAQIVGGQTAFYLALFSVGVAGAQYPIAWPSCVPRWALWLGRVAYSLYLTNWLVFEVAARYGPVVVWASLPLTLVVAWGLERTVERPSILLSRRVG
jgi:peptidoglycan/LPS O-acetylase OafA/YrhL